MLTTRLRAIFGCAASMAVGLSLATAARADQNLNCDAYAAAAVAQQNENLALGCGFTGGAWSTDYQGHRAWCLRPEVQMADVTREDRARADWLGLCGQKQAACADYAALAVEQNRMNRRWRCGFTGGRWSDDATGHRAWCMTADVDQASGESKARETALGGCAVKGASDDASLAQTDLQNMQQRQQQILQMMRNVSKAMHDAAMGTVRKMQ